jgi:hypothetical protein
LALDSTVPNRNPLPTQPAHLLVPVTGREFPGSTNHTPPRKTGAPRQYVANRTGRPWVAGSASDLPIADDLTATEVADDGLDFLDERASHARAASISSLHGA